MLAACVFAVGFAVALSGPALPRDDPVPPTFPEAYTASGYILLPYANLSEPFTANFDAKQKKSRIDYYDGTMKTFQINAPYTNSPEGANFKIVWSPNRYTHVPENICYQANASDNAPVGAQSVFPDLTSFKFAGEEDCNANTARPDLVRKGKCWKWTSVVTNFTRNSTYTFYAVKEGSSYTPVRYVMLGYDSLFGSHYDLYEMIYTKLVPGAQDTNVFDALKIAPAGRCVPYPDGSGLSSGHLFNPMRALIHHDESHVEEHFNHFKAKHSKVHGDATEEAIRKNNFRHNQRYIDSMNRKNKDFKLKVNHLADLHQNEMKFLRGRKYESGYNGGQVFPGENFVTAVPISIDWRKKGVVSAVKDQAICGSCWSFGATGNLEAMYALKHNKNVRFSEQQLIDCSWNFGNGACDGGQDYQAYRYVIQHGLSTDEQYGPYLGIDGKCHDGPELKREIPTLLGYVNVTGEANLRKAIANVGPISVGIFAALPSLSFYHEGIFNDKDCKNGVADLDHAVLAVGYDVAEDGREYWIVKNSWSTHWGEQGYVKIAVKGNICGVSTAATYALVP